ncbi:MAG: hypothetical protein AAB116_02690, partial [Candidatus Poribacteria bacterium]
MNNERENISMMEYGEINTNIRSLAEVRFKLLAFVPTLGGAAIFVLSQAGLTESVNPSSSNSTLLAIIIGLFGFLA